MMTTKNIIKEPPEKAKEEPPPPNFKEEGIVRATNKPEPPHDNPATAGYLSPAQAAAKEAGIEINPAARETTNAKLLRVITIARERLRGRGMPELDIELDELIEEIRGWGP
jgi:hypothetical protein